MSVFVGEYVYAKAAPTLRKRLKVGAMGKDGAGGGCIAVSSTFFCIVLRYCRLTGVCCGDVKSTDMR